MNKQIKFQHQKIIERTTTTRTPTKAQLHPTQRAQFTRNIHSMQIQKCSIRLKRQNHCYPQTNIRICYSFQTKLLGKCVGVSYPAVGNLLLVGPRNESFVLLLWMFQLERLNVEYSKIVPNAKKYSKKWKWKSHMELSIWISSSTFFPPLINFSRINGQHGKYFQLVPQPQSNF